MFVRTHLPRPNTPICKKSKQTPIIAVSILSNIECSYACFINSKRVTVQYTETIWFHIHGIKKYCDHLQNKRGPGWKSNTILENVDMQDLVLAFKSLNTPYQNNFISKMLHGWLNTGQQCQIITKDPNSSNCPFCQAPNESFEHILLHCSAQMVVKAGNKTHKPLSDLTRKSFSVTMKVLQKGLSNWLKDGDKMLYPCLDNYYAMRPNGGQST